MNCNLTIISVLCLCLFQVGCGTGNPPTYPVTGTLSFRDGTPLRTGFIECLPASGGPSARGVIGSDGSFVLSTYGDSDGAAAGEYVALVTQINPSVEKRDIEQLGPEHDSHADTYQVVSLKYANQSTSDLKFTVSPVEKNHFDFSVESL